MKNIGIICEYNPMHNGHIHQINKIKEIYPHSNIIAIMSGSFVQRGEPAIIDKFIRANIAIENGIDLVLEVPTLISLQSADYFSYYIIKILNSLNVIDAISFGIEYEDIKLFIKKTKILLDNSNIINKEQKKYIDLGLSYKNAYIKAVENLFPNISDILKTPNNTLGIKYIESLMKLKSNIDIIPINRIDGGYNSNKLDNYEFQSASTLRNLINKKNNLYKNFIPKNSIKIIENSEIHTLNDYNEIFLYKTIIDTDNKFTNIPGYENGLLNLIKNNYLNNISDTIEKIHNKRYSKSRIQRFIINYLLNITKNDIDMLENINYIRPLAFNEKGRKLINKIKMNSKINIINKINKIDKLSNFDLNSLYFDKKSYELYNIKNISNILKNFINNPYKKIP